MLRDYQRAAVESVRREYRAGRRSTLLVMATGTGKTTVGGAILDGLRQRGHRALFIAHSGELLEQAERTFAPFGLRCGFEKANARVDERGLPDVVLGSVQTLRGDRLVRFEPNAFWLVVVDEGHHGAADSYKAVLNHFSGARVLGLSATPDRGDGKPLSAVYESVAYRLEMSDAIDRGILCPLELLDIAVEGLDLESVKTRAGDFAPAELEEEVLRDAVLHGMARPFADHLRGRRTVAFLPGVASSHGFAEVLQGYGLIAVAVDGSMAPQDRRNALSRYERGEASVVCCSDLLLEGWDHPPTDCVALCRPTKSRSRLVQMIGRGARLHPGKERCLVANFVPGTVNENRLLAPEDALSGSFVIHRSAGTTYKQRELEKLEAMVREEQRRIEHQHRFVESVGVHYAITRMPLLEFLSAAGGENDGESPGERQLEQLERLGLSPDELSSIRTGPEASAVIAACAERRAAGLCTRAQHNRLKRYGYPDTLTFEQANNLMSRLKANAFRPLESKDKAASRFARAS
jgi:superfamily II DNA or RNA helicase